MALHPRRPTQYITNDMHDKVKYSTHGPSNKYRKYLHFRMAGSELNVEMHGINVNIN